MAKTGDLIGGKYEILTEVGRGGMSIVYLALDRNLGRQWAVKEIQKEIRGRNNEVYVQSALNESDMLKTLDHPALPRIVDIVETPETINIVMDYIPGESMDAVLQRDGAMPYEQVLDYAKQLCEVMGYLHSQNPPIIYRDMKPNNVKVLDGRLRVFDFGIARTYKVDRTRDTENIGTRGYAAPEAFLSDWQTDARSDIYSLGITLYYMITGKSPADVVAQNYPIRHWNPALNGGFEAIIQKCIATDPNDRFQSCAELMSALEDPDSWDPDNKRELKKRFTRFIAAALAAGVFLFGGALFGRLEKNNAQSIYRAAIAAAEKETTVPQKVVQYRKAISYVPDGYEAYLGLVNAFKQDDGTFTTTEESDLLPLLNENGEALRASPEDYVNLSFEVGKLYWFYYDYGTPGENELTRVKSAIPWFSDVVNICDENGLNFSHYSMSQIFRDIGIFNRDYSLNIQEASGNGTYITYWNNLNQMMDYLDSNGEEEELVLWEGYQVISFSVENYMNKFKVDGVTREEMETLCTRLQEVVNRLDATDEKTETLRDGMRSRLDARTGDIWTKIALTYQ